MTKQEALSFLELADTATTAEIKTRLVEKLEHFETLSEKAPSDFLRRLNLRNLDKVKAIMKESLLWPSFTAEPEPVAQESTEVAEEETAQTVYIVSSLKESVLKQAEAKASPPKRLPGEPAGWLIKHTEDQPATTYTIQDGINFIGRKKQAALEPFIVIEGDDFISRVQCVIYAEEDSALQFFISDPAAFNNGKTSKNGTSINGSTSIVTQKEKLADGDTIQLGVSKFVVRYNTGDIEKIKKEVAKSKYVKTVVLEG